MRKAQSTLEYVIILTAIIAVIIVFAQNALKNNVRDSLEHVSNETLNQVRKIKFGNTAK